MRVLKNKILLLLVSAYALAVYPAAWEWRIHSAFGEIKEIAITTEKIYAIADGILFAVDKQTEEMTYYDKQKGLVGNIITHIKTVPNASQCFIFYDDGKIDRIDDDGSVHALLDIYNAANNYSKTPNCVAVAGNYAYIGMSFGIIKMNLRKYEISETCYIGDNATSVNVKSVCIVADTLFAMSDENILYKCSLGDNLMDFHFWKKDASFATFATINALQEAYGQPFLLADSLLYTYAENQWWNINSFKWDNILSCESGLYAQRNDTTFRLNANGAATTFLKDIYTLALENDGESYWIGTYGKILRYDGANFYTFTPNGPANNYAYRLRCANEKTFCMHGNNSGALSTYNKKKWSNYDQSYFFNKTNRRIDTLFDVVAEKNNPNHFFVGSTNGMIEFVNNELTNLYDATNSGLDVTNAIDETRVTEMQIDTKGNLWVGNSNRDGASIKMRTKSGQWYAFNAAKTNGSIKELLVLRKNENIKIFISANAPTIGFFNDNGTWEDDSDDILRFHSSFIDQDGNTLTPKELLSIAQDNDGALWIGTNAGPLIVENPEMLHRSNECTRIKIARNDGSGLADYLLGSEPINAIAIDGDNRKWLGTNVAGACLMSQDGTQTIQHFTTDNAPLLSNTITTIAVNPITGEVFFGNEKGIVSYQNDASEGRKDMKNIYVYPNPVREDFDGDIIINGLMENALVYITDASGTLVHKAQAHGGMVVWNGRVGNGQKAATGVYHINANSQNGKKQGEAKILILKK